MSPVSIEVARIIRAERKQGATLAALSKRHKLKLKQIRLIVDGGVPREPLPPMWTNAEFNAWWREQERARIAFMRVPEPTAEQSAAFAERVNRYMERTGIVDDVRADVRRRVLNRLLRAGADVGSK